MSRAERSRKNPTYSSWAGMLSRCRGSSKVNRRFYIDRGIRVCERWHSFDNFLVDMGDRPVGKTLDRIDVNGNYEPLNCRWITQKEQTRNKTNNRIATHNGVTAPISQLAEMYGHHPRRVFNRLDLGWSLGRALETPAMLRGKAAKREKEPSIQIALQQIGGLGKNN